MELNKGLTHLLIRIERFNVFNEGITIRAKQVGSGLGFSNRAEVDHLKM